MRVIFNEGLKAVADDLDHMARDVRDAIRLAGEALLHQDLDAAQTVIDNDASIDDLSTRIMDQCVELLARQNPVATDLRVIVSTMRLATTFERMGDLRAISRNPRAAPTRTRRFRRIWCPRSRKCSSSSTSRAVALSTCSPTATPR